MAVLTGFRYMGLYQEGKRNWSLLCFGLCFVLGVFCSVYKREVSFFFFVVYLRE